MIDPRNVDQLVLLDGGMGQELISRGACEATPLWSAQALFDNPDMVGQLHEDFIAAGADVIITNTYSTQPVRFAEYVEGNRLQEFIELAAAQAQGARERSGRDVLIAGSLPPLRGSYRPDRVAAYDILAPDYELMAGLLAPHVDFLICETMTTLDESRAARDGAATAELPVWVSWTLQNHAPSGLVDGTSFETAVEVVEADAYLINCTDPETVELALPLLVAATTKPVGAYANAFTHIPEHWSMQEGDELPPPRTDLGPVAYSEHVLRCVDAGALIVGGCCEIGPNQIAHLSQVLRQ